MHVINAARHRVAEALVRRLGRLDTYAHYGKNQYQTQDSCDNLRGCDAARAVKIAVYRGYAGMKLALLGLNAIHHMIDSGNLTIPVRPFFSNLAIICDIHDSHTNAMIANHSPSTPSYPPSQAQKSATSLSVAT